MKSLYLLSGCFCSMRIPAHTLLHTIAVYFIALLLKVILGLV